MTSAEQLLADRYGRKPKASAQKRRLLIWAVSTVAVTIFVIWALTSIGARQNAVAVVKSGAKPLSATSFQVSGEVSRPKDGVVRCALQIKALNFAVVGYREITLAAGVTKFDEVVYSAAPGVDASVARCWLQ